MSDSRARAAADARPLLQWTLSFLKPYRTQVIALSSLLFAEIILNTLQPWPLKVVIDYVLEQQPIPEPFARWLGGVDGGSRVLLLVILVVAGVVVQITSQLVSAFGTQVQIDAGQRMVYDLRYRLFDHLQALGLHHHIMTKTGDTVYRIDVDSYSVENLVMSGVFPLATAATTLVVMFAVLLKLDVTVALLSLSVVPFLYLCLRYYTRHCSRAKKASRNQKPS
jgi:ATP-binding cassette subfamily B protein/subfamily B ATP-binding cassette protein MsbA